MSKVRKGKTYEEIFGVEKATELREKRRKQTAWNRGQKTDIAHVKKAKASRAGLFFITDGFEDRKIRGEIPKGWRKGRTNGTNGLNTPHKCHLCDRLIIGKANLNKHILICKSTDHI